MDVITDIRGVEDSKPGDEVPLSFLKYMDYSDLIMPNQI